MSGHLWDQNTYLRKRDVVLQLPFNGEQNVLLAALLRNEFKSFVVRFTTHVKTCLAKNQVVESCVNIDF